MSQSDNWKPKLPYFKSTNVSQVKLAMQKNANLFKCHLWIQTAILTNIKIKSKKCNKKRRPGVVVSTNTLPPKYILDLN